MLETDERTQGRRKTTWHRNKEPGGYLCLWLAGWLAWGEGVEQVQVIERRCSE